MTGPTFQKSAADAARLIMTDLRNRKDFAGKLPTDTMLLPKVQRQLFARIEEKIARLIFEAHHPLIDELRRLSEAAGRADL